MLYGKSCNRPVQLRHVLVGCTSHNLDSKCTCECTFSSTTSECWTLDGDVSVQTCMQGGLEQATQHAQQQYDTCLRNVLKSTRVKWTQVHSSQLKLSQVNSTRLKSIQLNSSQLNSVQLSSTRPKSGQVKMVTKPATAPFTHA